MEKQIITLNDMKQMDALVSIKDAVPIIVLLMVVEFGFSLFYYQKL